MKKIVALALLTVGVAGCGPPEKSPAEADGATAPLPTTSHYRATDYTLGPGSEAEKADTLILIGSRHYRLRLRAETDSTRPVDYGPASGMGRAFAVPGDTAEAPERVRGYWGEYVFWLSDSTGRQTVFRQHLNKTAFYHAAPTDLVVVTPTDLPNYQGYSKVLNALVFIVAIYPGPSDFGFEATVLLDAATGQVRHLGPAHSAVIRGLDCAPRLAPNGRAVLTCSELIRAGKPPLNLNNKPHARLVGARFLSDSIFVTMYEYGDERPRSNGRAIPELVVPAALRHAPRASSRSVYGL